MRKTSFSFFWNQLNISEKLLLFVFLAPFEFYYFKPYITITITITPRIALFVGSFVFGTEDVLWLKNARLVVRGLEWQWWDGNPTRFGIYPTGIPPGNVM